MEESFLFLLLSYALTPTLPKGEGYGNAQTDACLCQH